MCLSDVFVYGLPAKRSNKQQFHFRDIDAPRRTRRQSMNRQPKNTSTTGLSKIHVILITIHDLTSSAGREGGDTRVTDPGAEWKLSTVAVTTSRTGATMKIDTTMMVVNSCLRAWWAAGFADWRLGGGIGEVRRPARERFSSFCSDVRCRTQSVLHYKSHDTYVYCCKVYAVDR